MYPVENNYLRSANLDRLQIMVGLKGNAKEKLDGSHLDTLKEGTAFLRARWLKCSDIFPALTFLCSRFCTCMFCSRVVTNMRIPPLTAFFFFLTCHIVKSPLCANWCTKAFHILFIYVLRCVVHTCWLRSETAFCSEYLAVSCLLFPDIHLRKHEAAYWTWLWYHCWRIMIIIN